MKDTQFKCLILTVISEVQEARNTLLTELRKIIQDIKEQFYKELHFLKQKLMEILDIRNTIKLNKEKLSNKQDEVEKK